MLIPGSHLRTMALAVETTDGSPEQLEQLRADISTACTYENREGASDDPSTPTVSDPATLASS